MVMLPMCTIFCHALKILTALIFLIAIKSLTRNSTSLNRLCVDYIIAVSQSMNVL